MKHRNCACCCNLVFDLFTEQWVRAIPFNLKLTRNFNYCIRESYANESNKAIVDAFIAYLSTVEGKATIKDKGGILVSSSSEFRHQYA